MMGLGKGNGTLEKWQFLVSSMLDFWGVYSLGGGFKHFFFHPFLGKIPILTHIFHRG